MIKTSIALFTVVTILSACASSRKPHQLTNEERCKLLIETAITDLNEGDATGALVSLKEAASLNHKVPEIHYLLTITYSKKNEPGLAQRSALKAIELSPNFSPAKNALGKLLMDQGKYNEAEKYLIEAAQDLTYREAYLAKTNLGILFYKKTDHAAAERWLSKAIFDAGDNACMAYYQRGQIHFEKNLMEKANADFTRASQKNCIQFSDAHLAVGKTFIRMKKYDQARAKLLETQQLFPTSDAATKANHYLRDIP